MPVDIGAAPLDAAAYAPYGGVIAARPGSGAPANQGTARRFNFLAELEDLRPGRARANVCVYRCAPAKLPFAARLLERHPRSTQLFIPMGSVARYLVIVALGGERPDLGTLKAFVATGGQGISYRAGVWHHPMVALDRECDLACVVFEDGGPEDCQEFALPEPISISAPRGRSRAARRKAGSRSRRAGSSRAR